MYNDIVKTKRNVVDNKDKIEDELKISVIIPVYNVEQYVERCIKSVIGQTYRNIEIILVNDGSTDNSRDVCEKLKKQDSRIILIDKENGGLSSARNTALSVVSGELITFVDSDDLIHPKMLEWMYNELKDNNADIVSTGLASFETEWPERFTENVNFERLTQKEFIDHLFPENFGKISVTACGKLYKREIFDEIRYPEGLVYEDLHIYLELLLKCNTISVCDVELYYWYNNRNSITRSTYLKHNRFDEFAVREKYISFYEERNLQEQVLLAANDYLTFFMRNYFAVTIKYKEKKKDFSPHLKIFKTHIRMILKNPYVCRARKVCVCLMLITPIFAWQLAKYTIPDCLIEEMR